LKENHFPAGLADYAGVDSGSLTGSWNAPVVNSVTDGELQIAGAGAQPLLPSARAHGYFVTVRAAENMWGLFPWTVGIQHPRKEKILASIETLNDESIFTSGDYQRYYMDNGQRRHHILDPFTGKSVNHTMATTVIHDNATVADAAATAIMAAGPEHWHEVARALNIHYVLLLASDGTLYMNPAMHERLELSGHEPYKIVLGPSLK